MSEYRDGLPAETRDAFDEAVTQAGRLLASTLSDLWHDGRPLADQAA